MSSTKPSKSIPPSGPAVTVKRLVRGNPLTNARIRQAVRLTLGDRPVAELNVAIVDDERMAGLHEEFMGDNSPTDVLTFDLREDMDAEAIEGEIVVSADTARREADRRGLDPDEELTRYIIHGVLHLLGLDDHTTQERQRMRREENRVLEMLARKTAPKRATRATAKSGNRNSPKVTQRKK